MNFEDERYVRVYTRKTVTTKLLGWEGRMCLHALLLEVDRAGVLDLEGMDPAEALAALADLPIELVRVGMNRIVDRGVAIVAGGRLFLPRFMDAQEAKQSDAQRQRESRARRAAELRSSEGAARSVTERDRMPSQPVTECHDRSRGVTSSHSVLSCAQPSSTEEPPTPSEGVDYKFEDVPTDAKAPEDPTAGQTPRVDPDDEVVTKVFEFWKREHDHPKAKLERKRRSRIKARLREGFTGRELCIAIRAAKQDKFLMGENEHGRVYDSLSTLLRDAEQVERLIAIAGHRRGEKAEDQSPNPLGQQRLARLEAQAQAQHEAARRELEARGVKPASSEGRARILELAEGIGG